MKCQDCTGDNGPVNTVLKDAFPFPSIKKKWGDRKREKKQMICVG